MKDNKVLFEIDDFKVYVNGIYTISDKEDLGAPSGLLEAGLTKLPSAGVDETFQCGSVKVGANKEVWDTGFYTSSPCYRTINPDQAAIIVSNLKKNLVDPYEIATSDPNVLIHTNEEFWNSEFFKVSSKKVFNTTVPKEALELYFALRTKNVVPEDKIGDRRYKNASFVIKNFAQAQEFKHMKSALNSKATGMFEMLLNGDKQTLFSILQYNKITFSDKVHDDTLRGMFQQYLSSKQGTANVATFLKTCEEIKTEEGKEKILVYVKLKDLVKNSDIFKKKTNGKFYFKGTEVGPDIRTSAENIVTKKEFSNIKDEIILNSLEELEEIEIEGDED